LILVAFTPSRDILTKIQMQLHKSLVPIVLLQLPRSFFIQGI
jgi:hypothetical protein